MLCKTVVVNGGLSGNKREERETGVVGLLASATRAHSRPHAEEKEPVDPGSYFDSLKTA
jgi:hypothetical protein